MPKLIVEAGKQVGKEFEVRPKMTLGRLDTCDARIQDDNASREHAAIRLVDGRYYVVDLKSRNGTTVNGRRVRQSPLAAGDRIGIGDTVLIFFDEEHSARPVDTLDEEAMRRLLGSGDSLPSASASVDEERPAPAAAEEATPDPGPPGVLAEGAGRPAAPRAAPRPQQADPAAATGKQAPREPAPPPPEQPALEAALLIVLLALTLLCASYATQIVLRLLA